MKCIGKFLFGTVGYARVLGLFAVMFLLSGMSAAQTVNINPNPLAITEGMSGTFTAVLSQDPGAAVNVEIPATTGLSFSSTFLQFNAGNWSTEKTVTVTASQDTDQNDESHTIAFNVIGGIFSASDLTVNVTDDDKPTSDLVLSAQSLRIGEGSTGTFDVKLSLLPSATVTVTLTQPTNTDVTVNKTSLTFTTTNWNVNQRVTVSAGQDTDTSDDSASITLSASGGGYDDASGSVSVDVTDDDTASFILPSNDVSVNEGGSNTFNIRLATLPSGNVTVTLTQPANTDVTVGSTSLSFTPANWDQTQSVTVNAAQDADTADESASISVSATGGGYGSATGTVGVDVTDDDTEAFILPSSDLSVNEGSNRTFSIGLATLPSGSVTVTLAQPTNTDVTVSITSLTFTTGNWDTNQTVTVRAAHDNDLVDDSASISVSATGGGYGSVTGTVGVDVTDDDTGTLILPSSDLAIDEGSNGTFDVKLSNQPSANVTVTLTQPTNTDVTVDTNTSTSGNQTTLTFTSSNWNVDQAVTVSAADDDDTLDDDLDVSIAISAAGGGFAGVSGTVVVDVTDDDEADLTLPSSDVSVDEGSSTTFAVKLATMPSENITVTLTQPSDTDVTVDTDTSTNGNQTTLTFTAANWNVAQNVTVSAAEDDDAWDKTDVTISLSAAGDGYDDVDGTVKVDVTDDDEEALTISPTDLAIVEGAADQEPFTVKLATLPSAAVTLTVTQPTNTDIKADTDLFTTGVQTTLTFSQDNWNEDQVIGVTAAQDNDTSNESGTITLSTSGGGYNDISEEVDVTVTDDDAAGLVLPSSVRVDEGGNETIDVRLSTLPSGTVTVTLTQPSDPDVKVDTDTSATGNQTTLTFTTSNWNVNQQVKISVAQDNDSTNDETSIPFSVTGGGYDGISGSVTVRITDDETDRLDISQTDLTVLEENSVTFQVKLLSQPTSNVTVTVNQASPANADVSVDTDNNTGGDQNTLVFTTTNWNVYQTVTVSTVHDQDTVNDSADITLTASSNYGGVTGLVKITITDNDSENLSLPSGTVVVAEGGNATFDVSLSTQPSGTVTVDLTVPSGTDLTLDKTTLSFTTGNWNTAQTVKVSAAQDHDASNDSATISFSATGGGYSGRTGRVSVSVTDDDTPALSITPSSLSVTEGGSVTFDVKLATLPSANVTVTLSAQANPDVSVDKTTLAFTPANWSTAQRVRVSAAEDNDLDNDRESIVLSASGGDYANIEESVNVTVADNDNAGLTVSPTTLDLTEGRQGTFTVRLTQRPSGDVSVTLTLPSGSDVSADKASLTFTDDDWDKQQTVTVRVAQDDDALDDGTSVISLASSGGGYDNLSVSVSVDVTDDDEDSLVLPPNALKIAEGSSGRFAVSLATLPSGTVSVTLTQPSNPDVRVDADPDANGEQTALTFTSSNWNTPQLVAVFVGDDDDSSNESASIALSATGGGYAGKTGSVGVEVEDDDSDALVITPNPLNFAEGESGTFTVRLATLPSADVTVAVQPSDNADISLDKTSLTFTQANWKDEQTVTATSIQDDDIESDEATVDLSASGGGYDGVGTAQRIVVTDDDAAGLTVSPGSLRIDEGGSAFFTMRLVRQPSGDVRVNLDAQNNPDVTLDKTTLTFASGAWNTSQTVRVSANHDADDSDERLVILYTASGSGYDSVSGDVSVEIVDDDEPSTTLPANTQGMITVSLEAIQIDEGTQRFLDVGLDGIAQASDVTIFLTNINPDITLSPSRLTFTPSNWNEDQRISIKVAGDADGIDDSDTITLAATGIDVPSRQVSVSVRDDEQSSAAGERGAIVVNPGTLVIGEGSSKTFTARLVGNAPFGNVNVLLGKTNDDIAISPQSLTFDSSNWESDQVITVTLAQDADDEDDADTITLSAIGGGYDRARRSLAVVGIDNPGTIEVSTDRIGLVGGGDPVSFVVRLGMSPTGTQVVIVSLSSSNPGIEITPPSLIFTADNWDTGQSASAKAAADSDRQGGLDIITLAATGGNYSSASRAISVSYTEGGSQPPATLSDPVRTQALAMPSSASGDQSTLFVHCKQDTPCTVYLDCSAQSDGSALQGAVPGQIPARGIRMLTAQDIETHVGDSWSGKGRLGCALRSAHRIDSQVWTRSGDGVLVNNSAYLRSDLEGQRYRADIESITSPDGFEKSNIRIRCAASGAMSCTSTRFTCYEDDGTRYESDAFEIGASVVRHVQSEELAGMINHRWQGMGMTCELRSDAPFTVQILTRTGGGGALVNNSAGGEVKIGSGG